MEERENTQRAASIVGLNEQEAAHVHACLVEAKNHATREGRIWSEHGLNARIRTRIERAVAS